MGLIHNRKCFKVSHLLISVLPAGASDAQVHIDCYPPRPTYPSVFFLQMCQILHYIVLGAELDKL